MTTDTTADVERRLSQLEQGLELLGRMVEMAGDTTKLVSESSNRTFMTVACRLAFLEALVSRIEKALSDVIARLNLDSPEVAEIDKLRALLDCVREGDLSSDLKGEGFLKTGIPQDKVHMRAARTLAFAERAGILDPIMDAVDEKERAALLDLVERLRPLIDLANQEHFKAWGERIAMQLNPKRG